MDGEKNDKVRTTKYKEGKIEQKSKKKETENKIDRKLEKKVSRE